MDNENDTIDKVRCGDTEAYRPLVERYQTGLIIYIEKMVQSRADAEDIAQDVFVKAYAQLDKFDEQKGRFSTWLYRIAANATIDFLRKHRRTFVSEDIERVVDMTQESTLYDDEVEQLRQAVEELEPPKLAEVIRAYYWEGKSYQEIAELHDTTTNTIGTWMSRAKQQLREVLQ